MSLLVTKAQELIKGRPPNAADETFINHVIDAVTAVKSKVTKDVRSKSSRLQILLISPYNVEFRLPRLRAQLSPRSLTNASKSPTTRTVLARRRERPQKCSERHLACECCYDFISQMQQFRFRKPNSAFMFEILLAVPSSDEDVAQEWDSKRLYGLSKVG